MKTKTMSIIIPTIQADDDNNVLTLERKERFYGIPACVTLEYKFQCEVQRYIDVAYGDYFQWKADASYAKYDKNGDDDDYRTYEFYSNFADSTYPENKSLHCDFAFLYAFCIDSKVRTNYYRDEKGRYTHRGVTVGEYGVELFELFSDYSMSNLNDAKMSIARQQLRAWFGDVIANTDYCKAWNTSKITIDTTRRLVNYAGIVTTHIRRDFQNKPTEISKFTEQALAKCFQSCFKMKVEPKTAVTVFVVK